MNGQALGPQVPAERRQTALDVRIYAARAQQAQVHPVHMNNDDDNRYADRRASFTKGLKHHTGTGLVDQAAYELLLNALSSGVPEHFYPSGLIGLQNHFKGFRVQFRHVRIKPGTPQF